MVELLANSGYPDQTPRSAASGLGLHCLPITLLRVSRLQWVIFVEIDHEIFSTVILSLPLIQEGQLSVSGERMSTILVNR